MEVHDRLTTKLCLKQSGKRRQWAGTIGRGTTRKSRWPMPPTFRLICRPLEVGKSFPAQCGDASITAHSRSRCLIFKWPLLEDVGRYIQFLYRSSQENLNSFTSHISFILLPQWHQKHRTDLTPTSLSMSSMPSARIPRLERGRSCQL